MRRIRWLAMPFALLLAVLAGSRATHAQNTPATLTIGGLVAHPLTLGVRDLVWLPPTQLGGTCADGAQHVYTGIDLAGILAAAGLQGADPLQSYITVTGADGHSVLIAWEEIDRLAVQHGLVGPMLAIDLDGAPLTDGGPLKLVWDGCPTARDVDSVQTITVGSFAPGSAAPAPPQSVDRAEGLAAAGLADTDLPGMTPRYIAVSEGAANPALPTASYRGYWAADSSSAKAIDSLRTFADSDTAHSAFGQLGPQELAFALGCAADSVQDTGAHGIGDEDDGSTWNCVDVLGQDETYYGEVFRRGRVLVSVIAIDPPGDGGAAVTAWARTIDTPLSALPQ